MTLKSTFYLENQNSETTFVSSTFKVEETKWCQNFEFVSKKLTFGQKTDFDNFIL